jgi:hypothetical protein
MTYLWRLVPAGSAVPWWMGMAWRRWETDAAVVLVIPFNVPGAIVRAVWQFWRFEVPFLFSAGAQSRAARRRGCCGDHGPDGFHVCTARPGHEGPHCSTEFWWVDR